MAAAAIVVGPQGTNHPDSVGLFVYNHILSCP